MATRFVASTGGSTRMMVGMKKVAGDTVLLA